MSQDSKKLKTSPPSLLERGLGGEVDAGNTNWRAWYWLVLGALAAEVAFFMYLTQLFTA